MGKQLTARNIAEEFGESSRHWTKMADSGLVPGVRRQKDKAGWLFDLDLFRTWLEAGQPAPARPVPEAVSTSRAKPGALTPKQARKKAEFDAGIDRLVRDALKPSTGGRG